MNMRGSIRSLLEIVVYVHNSSYRSVTLANTGSSIKRTAQIAPKDHRSTEGGSDANPQTSGIAKMLFHVNT